MRFIASFLVSVLTAGVALAGEASFPHASQSSATTSTVSQAGLSGWIESIEILAPAVWTGAVTVVVGSETALSVASTAAGTYRPRTEAHNTAGVGLGLTNWLERFYIANDTVTVTVTTANTNVSDVTVNVRTDRSDK